VEYEHTYAPDTKSGNFKGINNGTN